MRQPRPSTSVITPPMILLWPPAYSAAPITRKPGSSARPYAGTHRHSPGYRPGGHSPCGHLNPQGACCPQEQGTRPRETVEAITRQRCPTPQRREPILDTQLLRHLSSRAFQMNELVGGLNTDRCRPWLYRGSAAEQARIARLERWHNHRGPPGSGSYNEGCLCGNLGSSESSGWSEPLARVCLCAEPSRKSRAKRSASRWRQRGRQKPRRLAAPFTAAAETSASSRREPKLAGPDFTPGRRGLPSRETDQKV
jgi:hypothetical protein